MKSILSATTLIALLAPLSAAAGTLTGSNWAPSEACGVRPEVPVVDDGSIEAYNKSVGAINAWQKKANSYFACLVKEANADNAIIADSANREQEAYRQAVETIGARVDAAKKKLDNQ